MEENLGAFEEKRNEAAETAESAGNMNNLYLEPQYQLVQILGLYR